MPADAHLYSIEFNPANAEDQSLIKDLVLESVYTDGASQAR